ncbi:DHH family phosphoesterase [Alkalicoccus luteus]|uniref:DHH family phosphoesterase n=1 Tax=Alkalicoccus luteus TaxID=1237094 RepID=UPI00403442A0
MTKQVIFNIWDTIEKAERIIIHRHVRPDPDAVGSQAGLGELIQEAFPDKIVKLAGEEEQSLTFLSGMDEVTAEEYRGALVIVTDTANEARIDGEIPESDTLIKIDHHPEVDAYGDIQWVNTEASSTCEMIFRLADVTGIKVTARAARLLFAGMSADTGRFRFSNTTPATFRAAASLSEHSFDRHSLYNEMDVTTLPMLRLQGYVLQEVEVTEEGAAKVYLTRERMESFGVTSREAASIVNCFSNLEGLRAWVFFVEEEDQIRMRIRSKGPVINKLAEKYRGGGHPMASGASAFSWEETDSFFGELRHVCRDSEAANHA